MAYYISDTINVPNFTVPFMGAQGSADFNGDGKIDMIGGFVNFGQPTKNEIKILANNGHGGFDDVTHALIEGIVPSLYQARQIVIADFNGDGRPDIFIANQGLDLLSTSSPGEPNVLLLSQANGKLKDVSSTHIPQFNDFSHSVSVGDVNGDGKLDLFVGNFSGTGEFKQSYFLINDGAGHFTIDINSVPAGLQPPTTSFNIGTSALADFNGDGHVDLFVGNHSIPGQPSGIYFGNETGSLANALFVPIPVETLGGHPADAVRTVVADFNLDGKLDLAVSYYGTPAQSGDFVSYQNRAIQLLLNDGTGHFSDVTETNLPLSIVNDGQVPQFAQDMKAIDINHDGFLDLVINNLNSGGIPPNPSNPVMWLNDGHAHFMPLMENDFPNQFGWQGYPSPFEIVDASGTGSSDLLTIGYRPELLKQISPFPLAKDIFTPAGFLYQKMYAETPSIAEYLKLAQFDTVQFNYGHEIGVSDPTVYVYEALGLALSQVSDTGSTAFAAKWGPANVVKDSDFVSQAYVDVFGHAAVAAQVEHFLAQINFFVSIYTASGAYGTDASGIDLLARGAVYGQMVGIRAEISDPLLGVDLFL